MVVFAIFALPFPLALGMHPIAGLLVRVRVTATLVRGVTWLLMGALRLSPMRVCLCRRALGWAETGRDCAEHGSGQEPHHRAARPSFRHDRSREGIKRDLIHDRGLLPVAVPQTAFRRTRTSCAWFTAPTTQSTHTSHTQS
jgi:hypothetical protein